MIILSVLFMPFVYTVPINEIDFTARLKGPSLAHPFGTDDLGQDLLARMLYGGRISLAVAFAAMVVAIVVGTVVGAIAGMSRGWVGPALMWLTDLFLSLPPLPLLLLVIYLFRDSLKAVFGPEGGVFILIVLVVGGLRWMPAARLVRAQFLSLREKEFVEAARALGASKVRQVVRHILPNALGPVIVAATVDVAAAIIAESTLSFLGLGFPPDIPSWGRILFDAKDYLDIATALGDVPGRCDLPDGAHHQLHRRRTARRARRAQGDVRPLGSDPGRDRYDYEGQAASHARASVVRRARPRTVSAVLRPRARPARLSYASGPASAGSVSARPAATSKLTLFARPDDARAPGPGFHLAFDAPTQAAVDAFHRAALQAGGTRRRAARPASALRRHLLRRVRDRSRRSQARGGPPVREMII